MSRQNDDDTTRIETLLDEPRDDEPRDDAARAGDTAPAGDEVRGPAPSNPYGPSRATPEFASGPAPTTSVVGLLGLLTVIAVLAAQTTDLDIPWGVVGPVAVVGVGVLLVVLGLAGLRGQRYRG